MPAPKIENKIFSTNKGHTKVPRYNMWVTKTKSYSRKDYKILEYLDKAIANYWEGRRRILYDYKYRQMLFFALFDIYASAAEWMHSLTRNPLLDNKAKEASKRILKDVRQLVYDTADELMKRMRVKNEIEMEKKLRSILELGLTDHGKKVDLKPAERIYLNSEDVDAYRVYYKDGKAFYATEGRKAEPINSTGRLGQIGYVFTINQILYHSGEHRDGTKAIFTKDNKSIAGFYHSAYTAGYPILCAGNVQIKKGVPMYIDNKSGHYKPNEFFLRFVIRHFIRNSVNVGQLRIAMDYKKDGILKTKVTTAPKYLASNYARCY